MAVNSLTQASAVFNNTYANFGMFTSVNGMPQTSDQSFNQAYYNLNQYIANPSNAGLSYSEMQQLSKQYAGSKNATMAFYAQIDAQAKSSTNPYYQQAAKQFQSSMIQQMQANSPNNVMMPTQLTPEQVQAQVTASLNSLIGQGGVDPLERSLGIGTGQGNVVDQQRQLIIQGATSYYAGKVVPPITPTTNIKTGK